MPAGIGLDNVLVVTASDDEGRIAEGASWGAATVDVAFPAGAVAQPFDGDRAAALENRAAIVAAALAASLAAEEAGLDGAALKARLLKMAQPLPGAPARQTRFGWVGPSAKFAPHLRPQ